MTSLLDAYDRMLMRFGPQGWWPGESPFEVTVGAVLTQNTAWKNVELALDNLREAGVLTVASMSALGSQELAELIRPAGYYRLKAKRLKNFLALVNSQFDGSLEALLNLGRDELRRTLLSVNGVGPETADSIVLYAAAKPLFVIDTYTARVLKRHGWIDMEADYAELQDLFHHELEHDVELFNEYHALLVRVGKEYCRKSPDCEACPLRPLLPHGGPLEIT